MTTTSNRTAAPWTKPIAMARKCLYCGSQRPGMQPLRLQYKDGNVQRGYWHVPTCWEKAKKEAAMLPAADFARGTMVVYRKFKFPPVRHDEPFAKLRPGKLRRKERRLVRRTKECNLQGEQQ